jgi:hypothetical protein
MDIITRRYFACAVTALSIAIASPVLAQSKKSPGMKDHDFWCKEQAGVLGGKKYDVSVIKEEFKISKPESLQDEFFGLLDRKSESKAFIEASYWRSSFETIKVRALYDNFLAFPEPEVLAALIELSRKSSDAQIKNDARMALAFLHLAAPELSVSPTRWSELVKQAGSEHWTALTFRARLAGHGELGAKQDLRTAMGLLAQAGNKKTEYKSSGGRSEWDNNNFEVPYNDMIFAVLRAAPGKFPAFESFNESLQKIEIAKQSYMSRWPSTRAAKLNAAAEKLNKESAEIGRKVLEMSQNANAIRGTLASYESLTATKPGDKPTVGSIDSKAENMLLTMYGQIGDLDPSQKQLLEQAQQKRYAAQGLTTELQSDLLNQLLGGGGGNGEGEDDIFVRAGMLAPVMMAAQNARIKTCIIGSKWEQAMRAKGVTLPDKKKTAENLASSNEFK